MKKISIYFTDEASLETAIEKAEREGYRLLDDEVGDYDYACPIKSDDGSLHGWVGIYTDDHTITDDIMIEEISDYMDY